MAIVFLNFNASAKIWRVNNNGNNPVPAIVSDFPSATTLQQVNDNATVASGDTIHLEQSPTTYGACIFTKRLIVIGAGYFLSQNPNTQVNTSYGTKVGDLTFYNVGSAGSFVYGCEVGNVNMGVNNLTIARCYFNASACLIGNNITGPITIDGMSLRQCFFAGLGGNYCERNNTGTGLVTNMNNYGNVYNSGYGPSLDSRVSGIFKNNVVYVSNAALSLQNFYVVNNLTYSVNGSTSTFTNCNVEYNAGTQANQFATALGSNSTYGIGTAINTTKTLAQMAFLQGASTDGFYQLGAGSLVIGIGKDGNDLGAFAGDYPYKLSGIAPVPNIYALTIAPISAGATTISVTVTAKGNN